jgi:PAS domain-containing protein
MDETIRHRRRHAGSTSGRERSSRRVTADRSDAFGKVEMAACVPVCVVALALIALIWMVTDRAVQEQRSAVRDRAEQALSGQAATIAETIEHELTMIEQSLTVIQAAWAANTDAFDLGRWQASMPALMEVADDLFICDEKHIIRQDILPQAVGQGVGADYAAVPNGALEQYAGDGTKGQGPWPLVAGSGRPLDARQLLTYVLRPLDHPAGWLVGASYRSEELTKLFAAGGAGNNAFAALVDTRRGVVQAIVGPAARRPRLDISQSVMFSVVTRVPAGTWLGVTAFDDTERLHAWHGVGKRDMVVVLGANWAEVTALADDLAEGAYALAAVGSALVLVIAGLVLWTVVTIRARRRHTAVFDRNVTELGRLRAGEAALAGRARLAADRLKVVMDSAADGIAVFDSRLCMVQWNDRFRLGVGVTPGGEMPLDALLRAQAGSGLFGAVADIEAEIFRRSGILRSGDPAGVPQYGPSGAVLRVRGVAVAEGGLILLVSRSAADGAAPEESMRASSSEW